MSGELRWVPVVRSWGREVGRERALPNPDRVEELDAARDALKKSNRQINRRRTREEAFGGDDNDEDSFVS